MNKKVVILLLVAPVLIFLGLLALSIILWLFQAKGNPICAQVITKACFLKSPLCFDFPTPCDVPPLWYETNLPDFPSSPSGPVRAF